ncbi:hypothetical protein ACIBCN_31140 [Nocardia sp. NPDC051052]|uniref:hypothetical protein n=1 Tax=Nocardia sp. NPDC051052 TaxID=3364322 RepID=UPI0037928156
MQSLFVVGMLLLLLGIATLVVASPSVGALVAALGIITMIGTVIAWSTLEPMKTVEEAAAQAVRSKRGWRPLWIGLGVLFVIVMGGGMIQVFLS